MSVRLMGHVFYLPLPPADKLVLLAMADHADDDGTKCYLSVHRLTQKTGYSRRGVQKIIRRLEKAGFLIPRRHLRGGHGLAREYRIIVAKSEPDSPFPAEEPRTGRDQRANMSAQMGERGSPQPSVTVLNRQTAAWTAIGVTEAFGNARFRGLLERTFSEHRGVESVLDLMERVAVSCQSNHIPVPPQFYRLKRAREAADFENAILESHTRMPTAADCRPEH